MSEDTFIVSGKVKWFDPNKGYGFIVSDKENTDILVHSSVLKRSGHEIIYPEALVKCVVIECDTGLQAEQILAVDNTHVNISSYTKRPTFMLSSVEEISDFQLSEVKWFNRIRGYGFTKIASDTEDIFLHMETLRECGIENVEVGMKLEVAYGQGPKGLIATRVRLVEEG